MLPVVSSSFSVSNITDPTDLTTILNNINNKFTSYLSLSSSPKSNIWHFNELLKAHPILFNEILVISIIIPNINTTFHMYPYHLHNVQMFNIMLQKTIQIQLANPYLAMISDEQYHVCPTEIDTTKYLVSKVYFCSQSYACTP